MSLPHRNENGSASQQGISDMNSRRVRPQYSDSESEDDYLGLVLRKDEASDEDDFSTLSFGALSSAQRRLREEDALKKETATTQRSTNKGSSLRENKTYARSYAEGQLDLDALSSEDGLLDDSSKHEKNNKPGRKLKHAPSESSSKKPVSRIREIPGLRSAKDSRLYQDVRFDAAYGKADWGRIRKDYAFLDEYRQKEVDEMQSLLKDKALLASMPEREVQDLKLKMQSLKSRLDTLKNRDLSDKIVANHKKEQMKKMRTGEQVNPYFLKQSEKRKMIQKAKFDSMKKSQREKVMERKRKRRLGKEFKQLEFRGQEQ